MELFASPAALCCIQFVVLLYVLMRSTAYCLCVACCVLRVVCCVLCVVCCVLRVVCCTGLCSYSAAFRHLQHLQYSANPVRTEVNNDLFLPTTVSVDRHIIISFEFSVRWNIRMRRQMMRHVSSIVALPTTQC